jgi:hypothetical protein
MTPSGKIATKSPRCLFAQECCRPWPAATKSQGSHARQLALSCDAVVLFERAPDLVSKLSIFSSGQSLCDLIRPRCRVDPASTFWVEIHQLADLEFVFDHAGIGPPDGHARRAARRQARPGNTGSGYPTRSAVACFCVMSDTGNGSAPGVMAIVINSAAVTRALQFE